MYDIMPNGSVFIHWPIEVEWCIYVSVNYPIIGLDNGLDPVQRQAIIWSSESLFLIGPMGTNCSLIEIQQFSYNEMNLRMSSAKLQMWWASEKSSPSNWSVTESDCKYLIAKG